MSPSDKSNLARIRDNQRRSRARRKEYLQELEKKVRMCELEGVQASAEVQYAARRVAEENKKLRTLLHRHKVADDSIDAFLKSGVAAPPGDTSSSPPRHQTAATGEAAQNLASLLEPRRPSFMDTRVSFYPTQGNLGEGNNASVGRPESNGSPATDLASIRSASETTPGNSAPHIQSSSEHRMLTHLSGGNRRRDAALALQGIGSLNGLPSDQTNFAFQDSTQYQDYTYYLDVPHHHYRQESAAVQARFTPPSSHYATTPNPAASSKSSLMDADIVSTLSAANALQVRAYLGCGTITECDVDNSALDCAMDQYATGI
ncbi:hypothetical protein NKR23_g8191 [Pleurostoma richardsiae]|uniref:BZIP domain-containing protein n=1 Tax=Pleurostoma richardsiae TaxID=41990 RepID=A0AA38VPW6_9PEZI|nr:hypothetical protein NKR23_g8191 [Pleurostoma richardsiae]